MSKSMSSQGVSSSNYHTGQENSAISYGGDNSSSAFPLGGQIDDLPQASQASSFLTGGQSKHEDLKMMLESSKDGLKLEAMKRIIGMIAKGRSGEAPRELFAHVVKNVVTKNAELKKLVYLYLTRYAEQEQDLALLSIATFQRSLKDPNPLIRASAIRVLSSIRVSMIAPIMLIAIRDCSNDMSPYVRKTAAHAIPKLYSLEPELKPEIIEIIARLLNDKTSLVLGSAVAAFEEICPDRFDLIHQNYRKFCSLLADVDEWGQVILINMLIRYARTQFTDPKLQIETDTPALLDPDLRMLLRSAKPLLQSRNSAVVLAVIQMYLSLAPTNEINAIIVKPLIRLLHSHREIHLVVLKNIASLTSLKNEDEEPANNGVLSEKSTDDEDGNLDFKPESKKTIRSLFDPYLKSFFIKAKDSTQAKILKLEILTNLSNSSNISLILREFQAYIMNYQDDLEFISATVQSIGHCASRIKEIAPICLNGLISLLSNRNEVIVSQSIVVIRTQIMCKDENDSIISLIIKQVTKLVDKIKTPQARATILWILAEYCGRNKRALLYSPDVLRGVAKTFCNEADLVKLQALNLAAKLYIINEDSERIKLLVNYLFNLAKYDLNYDVRDRGRFLRQLLNDTELARKILMATKSIPQTKQVNTGTIASLPFRCGTLSHFLGKRVTGYEELADWPLEQPDPSVRARPEPQEEPAFKLVNKDLVSKKGKKTFYSSDESSDKIDESEDSDEDEDDDEESGSDESEEQSVEESGEEEDEDEEEVEDEEGSEKATSSEEESSCEEDESESSEDIKKKVSKTQLNHVKNPIRQRKQVNASAKSKKKQKDAPVDLLLDFGDDLQS